MVRKSNNRPDALAKVTGKAVYTGDLKLPDMVYAKVLRSPISCGRILSINKDEAEASPGVLRVLTASDIPGVPALPRERPVLCPDKVRFIGDGVALVVAESLEAAARGLALVQVEYEEEPPLLDSRLALNPEASQVHEQGNRICDWKVQRGDVEAGFAAAEHILERSYATPRVQHVCLETEVAVASYDKLTGETTVHCPVNSPFVIRKTIAETLGCPYADVRVILGAIGASFGGKNYDVAMAASRAALASYILGRPCKVSLSREESIEEGTKRHPVHAHYKVGFNSDGTLVAAQIRILLDGGAYTSKTFPVTSRMAIEATGPYYYEHVDTISTSVYTNNVSSDALRGFGSPQVDFCSESLMDEIAAHLHMDPLVLRKKNMYRENGLSSFGQTMKDVTLPQCLEAMEDAVQIQSRKKRIALFNSRNKFYKKGLGFALLHRGESFGAAGQGIDTASGMLCIQQDGSALISSSIAEVGQGGPTMLINLVHEMLGLPHEKIRISKVDTSYVTDAGPTVATRGTVFSGNAVARACEQIKAKMTAYAAKRLGTDQLVFADDKITAAADPSNWLAFIDVVKDVFNDSEHLNALGYFAAPPLDYDKKLGVGEAYMSYVYGAAAAEVTVDLATGAVTVDDYFAVHDVGHAFDLEEVKGQILGGVSMGVGYALLEEVEMSAGSIRNKNLESYLIPTALDMPDVRPIVLEIPGPHGPCGAKGLGEPATCITAPAIINALADACGRRVRELPASLEQVRLGKHIRK